MVKIKKYLLDISDKIEVIIFFLYLCCENMV